MPLDFVSLFTSPSAQALAAFVSISGGATDLLGRADVRPLLDWLGRFRHQEAKCTQTAHLRLPNDEVLEVDVEALAFLQVAQALVDRDLRMWKGFANVSPVLSRYAAAIGSTLSDGRGSHTMDDFANEVLRPALRKEEAEIARSGGRTFIEALGEFTDSAWKPLLATLETQFDELGDEVGSRGVGVLRAVEQDSNFEDLLRTASDVHDQWVKATQPNSGSALATNNHFAAIYVERKEALRVALEYSTTLVFAVRYFQLDRTSSSRVIDKWLKRLKADSDRLGQQSAAILVRRANAVVSGYLDLLRDGGGRLFSATSQQE
jgi:hypothetical protein